MPASTDPAQDAARKIQERYRSFREKRELAGLALSKTGWTSLLNKVDIVLRTSQFEEAQPKQLSVRGKWIRGLGSARAIGRVRLQLVFLSDLFRSSCTLTTLCSRDIQTYSFYCHVGEC